MKSVLGIIGGSGLYSLPQIENIRTLDIKSPFGDPSSPLRQGQIGETQIVFLARHGEGHRIPPSEINYRANIDCLKRAGATELISFSACGSFHDDLPPGTFVLIDQFLDRTYRRQTSFFGTGCVAHVSMAEPVSLHLLARLKQGADRLNIPCQERGTYVAIEGPQFSSRAESLHYKSIGADVVGMTAMPEAKLAREAELSFAFVAMVTDFDCWHPAYEKVDAAMVMDVMRKNVMQAQALITDFAKHHPLTHEPCPFGSDRALDHAIMTDPAHRDPVLMQKLEAITARIVKTGG